MMASTAEIEAALCAALKDRQTPTVRGKTQLKVRKVLMIMVTLMETYSSAKRENNTNLVTGDIRKGKSLATNNMLMVSGTRHVDTATRRVTELLVVKVLVLTKWWNTRRTKICASS